MSCFTDMRVSSPALEQKLDSIEQILSGGMPSGQTLPVSLEPVITQEYVFEKIPYDEDVANRMREIIWQRVEFTLRETYEDTAITEEELLSLIDEQVELELQRDIERYFILPPDEGALDDALTPYHPYIIGALALGIVGAYFIGKGGKL